MAALPGGSRPPWILLAVLFLVPRLVLIGMQVGRPLQGDEVSYNQIARNVSSGQGYSYGEGGERRQPTAARGPSYVLLVAAFDRLFGDDRTPLFLFQVLLDAVSLLLIVRLARRWFRSWWVAWLAGVLYATYPLIVTNTASLLSETLTLLTLLLWVTLFLDWLERRRLRDLVLASVALGVCALSKPHLAIFGPVTCLAALPRLNVAQAGRALAVVVAVVTLTMAPWIARNALVFGQFVPGVSIGGFGLLFGSGAFGGRTIGSMAHPAVPDSVRQTLATMTELEGNAWAMKEALKAIREHPARYVRLSVLKATRLWFNVGFDEGRPSRSSLFVGLFNLAAIALAFIGARAAADPVVRRILIYGAIYWTVVHIPFFTVVRYAVPFYALIFVFTAAGLVVVARFLGPRRTVT